MERTRNIDQKIGELVTEGEPLAPEVIQHMGRFKIKMSALLDQTITPKKMAYLPDIAEKMINDVTLDSKIKIALITAFFKDLAQACLDKTVRIPAEQRENAKKQKTESDPEEVADHKLVRHYRDKMTSLIDSDISGIDATSKLPEKLKNLLRIRIFGSEKEVAEKLMDDPKEVLAARTALKDLMPLASNASISSFYAWVSKKFRDKRNA